MTSTSLSVRVESSGILGNDIYLPKCKSPLVYCTEDMGNDIYLPKCKIRVLWYIILRIWAMTSTSLSVRVESS